MLYATNTDTQMVFELTIPKQRQSNLGMTFRQNETTSSIIVDSVTPNGAAFAAGFRAGDAILAAQNRPVTSIQQLSKLVKATMSNGNVTFRVERIVDNYVMRTEVGAAEEALEEGLEVVQDSFVMVEKAGKAVESGGDITRRFKGNFEKMPKLMGGAENVSKIAQTLGNFGLRKRRAGTPLGTPQKQKQPDRKSAEMPEIIVRTDSENFDSDVSSNGYVEIYRGHEVPVGSVLKFNREYVFGLKEGHKYLNVNVWGATTKPNEKDVLLGYANLPLAHILYECCSSVLGHYIKRYSFLPPSNAPSNRSEKHTLVFNE